MSRLTESPAWKALARHHEETKGVHMRTLFAEDPKRFEKFSAELGDIFVDYYLKLKRSELGRYRKWVEENRVSDAEPTQWEQDEYFDFF